MSWSTKCLVSHDITHPIMLELFTIAFSIIYRLTPVEQTSHPDNSKFPIRRDPLANQIPTGVVLVLYEGDRYFRYKLHINGQWYSEIILRGNLPQIIENANLHIEAPWDIRLTGLPLSSYCTFEVVRDISAPKLNNTKRHWAAGKIWKRLTKYI